MGRFDNKIQVHTLASEKYEDRIEEPFAGVARHLLLAGPRNTTWRSERPSAELWESRAPFPTIGRENRAAL
jgi:hypothetical protein